MSLDYHGNFPYPDTVARRTGHSRLILRSIPRLWSGTVDLVSLLGE